MTIADLAPGSTFRLAVNGKLAVLLYVTPSGATIRYVVPRRHVVVPERRDVYGRVVPAREFEAAGPSRPVTVSSAAEVLPTA